MTPIRRLALCLLVAAAALPAAAAPLTREQVPDPLKPWIEWALHGHEAEQCPGLAGSADALVCAWPARLGLALDAHGGRFTQDWLVQAPEWAALPGGDRARPLDVKVDGSAATVVTRQGEPSVWLAPGAHTVAGSFVWDALPEAIHVPAATGLVSLALEGKPVPFPNRDAQGHLWLTSAGAGESEERLGIVVHRKVIDEVPLLLLTRIELNVSGKNREVLLGRALPDGFVPMTLASPFAARLDPDGRLRAQVRPGKWVIELTARHSGPVAKLALGKSEGPWADEEVWVFQAKDDLRLVSIEGVAPIDPRQTTVPEDWKALPTYRMRPGDTMTLAERRRGDADPAPDQLSLERTLWLDFDGGGYTIQDHVQGSLNRSWRLEMGAPIALGHVAIGGVDQFITRLKPGAPEGVEVRQGQVDVVAESRLEGRRSVLPAVGWSHDFHQVGGTLNLPPGWRLFSASGADDIPDTWLRHWTLLDLFLVLVISLAIGKLWGRRFGGLALVTLVLTFPEPRAPCWSWIFMLVTEALAWALPSGRLKRFAGTLHLAALIGLLVVAAPFLVAQARQGLYPALEYGDRPVAPQVMVRSGGLASNAPASRYPAAPLPPPVPQEELMAEGNVAGTGGASLADEGKAIESRLARKQAMPGGYTQAIEANLRAHDPKAIVQTGPGLPQWQWTSIGLGWTGPVDHTQTLRLRLVPPALNRPIAFLRVLLVLALAIRGLGRTRDLASRLGGARPPAGATVALVLSLLAPFTSARAAELPGPELLEQLRQRLSEKHACFPDCASCPRLALEASPAALQLRLEVVVAAPTAVPLPGGLLHWTPARVAVDGVEARGLVRDGGGVLWLLLAPGVHQVVLEGALPDRETVALPLPMAPARAEARAEGWSVDGIQEGGIADASLQLTRVHKSEGERGTSSEGAALPAFVRVERDLILGLSWEVETRVVRVTPAGLPLVLEVPLLPGESVITAGIRVEGGKALLNLPPQAIQVSWHSALAEQPRIELVAPDGAAWTEVWHLSASPIWHVAPGGIPVVHQTDGAGARLPEWRPWPGEKVTIEVSRPEGVAGQTVTIDSSLLALVPGTRATDATLDLSLKSSRGGQHVVTLPEAAVLESVSIDGAREPIRQEGRKVAIPLVPGARQVKLAWRETKGFGTRLVSPTVDLGSTSVNSRIDLTVPRDRWVLFVRGPRLGPAILFWGVLVIFGLFSLLLGRTRLTPLRAHHWFLLALGLTQASVWVWVLVAGWLLALGYRRRTGGSPGNFAFDLGQVALFVWTIAAVCFLVWSLQQGLLGLPDMQVSGNGSTRDLLRWYQDRSAAVLPQPSVVSLPLLAYRLAMLAWALWLAQAFLRWLRWGWTCFSEGGIWRPLRKPKPPAPPVPPPAPPAAVPSPAGPVAQPAAPPSTPPSPAGPRGERA